jgi:YVTN family beta-propeller protein
MTRIFKHLWLAFALVPLAAQADTVRIYVTNSAGDQVHVIDARTNKVVQVFKGPEAMHGVNFSPNGARVYISNESQATLDAFDRKSGKLIKQVPLSNRPNNIAVAKDGRIAVGIARGDGALDIVDPGTLTVKKTIPVHGRLHNVYVTPDDKYVITGSIPNKMLTVIDLATEEVAWEAKISAGVRPMTIETNPDGSTKRIFAQLSDFNGFAVIDFAQKKELARIELPKATQNFEIDGDRNTSPAHGIGVSPDNKRLWVTSIPNNAVYVYSLDGEPTLVGHVDLPALKLPGHEAISTVANWVTFTPDGKEIYISNAGLRSVTAIDTAAMKVKAVVRVGEVPKRINTLVLRDGRSASPSASGRRASLP